MQDAATVRAHDPELFERVKRGRARRGAGRAADTPGSCETRGLPAPPPLPQGPFEVILADPPWQLAATPTAAYAPENHYPTMALAEIKALAVPAAEDAVLFLWAVSCLLPEALEVMAAWGFEYKTNLVWVKPSIGLGAGCETGTSSCSSAGKGCFPPPEPEDLGPTR